MRPSLTLLLVISGLLATTAGPAKAQAPARTKAPGRGPQVARSAGPDYFPGQTLVQVTDPPEEAGPALETRPFPATNSAYQLQQVQYLKQKVQLGMPLTPQDLLFLSEWKRAHLALRQPKE